MATKTIIEEANLHFYEGNSDKVYHASIQEKGKGYVVFFSYGRRDGHMTEGYKTDRIEFPKQVGHLRMPLSVAKEVFEKLVNSKLKKGYSYR